MAKDPAFLFYSSDFLSGIVDLTMEERGQYITLLCLQHQKGHLPEKTIRLSVGSVSVDVLKKFEKDESGNYFNKRLDEEVEKRVKFSESRRTNGIKGGRPKASEEPIGLPYAKPSENLPENENRNKSFKDLNENELSQAFEFMFHIGRKEITKEDIKSFWKAFKTHKPESVSESRGKQMQHFRDWLKFQKKAEGKKLEQPATVYNIDEQIAKYK